MVFNITYSSIDDIYIVLRVQKLARTIQSKNYVNMYNQTSDKVFFSKFCI